MEIRTAFHRRLREIQDDVTVMGASVANALARSIDALKTRDIPLANSVIGDDKAINKRRLAVEEKCIELIATQQPMAIDLRLIVAVLNITTELERIADYAVGIARVVILIGDEPPLKPLIDIPKMTDITVSMLERSLEAFVNRDADAARKIISEDDLVDHLYDQIYRELLVFMMQDPRTVTRATRLMLVAHNLERAADRVTNICERAVFVISGKMEELVASKY